MASLEFEWDEAKNKANIAKHGVGFTRASAVFRDAFAIEYLDDRLDYGEERYVIIGMADSRLLRGNTTRRCHSTKRQLGKRRYRESRTSNSKEQALMTARNEPCSSDRDALPLVRCAIGNKVPRSQTGQRRLTSL